MSNRTVVIVQARTSSSRLPNKVLMPLGGRPSLVRLVERLRQVTAAADVVVATSTSPTDDSLALLCSQQAIPCYRGPLDDVLSRFHEAADSVRADTIVRITADCPLHDAAIVDRCIGLFMADSDHVEYVSNVDERTFPDGLDVEVFSFRALELASAQARGKFEREHVTPYLRRHMRKRSMVQGTDLADLRWTLDYQEDYRSISQIYDSLQDPSLDSTFTTRAIYELLLARPELILTASRSPLTDAEFQDVTTRISQLLQTEV